MSTTENGLIKSFPLKSDSEELEKSEVVGIIQLLTVGADNEAISSFMEKWGGAKKQEAWQIVAEYFRECSQYNPQLEKGKCIARLNLLFKNMMQIQDFKGALAIQKEINKMMRLYAR